MIPIDETDENELRYGGYRYRQDNIRLSDKDKMQPMLLDRLTDYSPTKRSEAAHHNLISHHELRRMIIRDLQWLLNCTNRDIDEHLKPFPEVQRSTLNYGIRPLSGKRMSDIEWSDIQRVLTQAILAFEPRILPDGLRINCVSDLNSLDSHNVLSIEIKGRLWCLPYPLDFLFRTDVDLETGHIELKDMV